MSPSPVRQAGRGVGCDCSSTPSPRSRCRSRTLPIRISDPGSPPPVKPWSVELSATSNDDESGGWGHCGYAGGQSVVEAHSRVHTMNIAMMFYKSSKPRRAREETYSAIPPHGWRLWNIADSAPARREALNFREIVYLACAHVLLKGLASSRHRHGPLADHIPISLRREMARRVTTGYYGSRLTDELFVGAVVVSTMLAKII